MNNFNKFEKFELLNQESITAGQGVVTWVGSDGNGNTLMDIHDTENGENYCSVNDYDLNYDVGDVVYQMPGATGGEAAVQAPSQLGI